MQEPNGFDTDDTNVAQLPHANTCMTTVAFEDPADPFDRSTLMMDTPMVCERWANFATVPPALFEWAAGTDCGF